MASRRGVGPILTACVAVGLVTWAIGGAAAQQQDGDETTSQESSAPVVAELVDRLVELEGQLPDEVPPTSVTIDPEATGGSFDADGGGLHATLDTLEPELRQLFVDADDADGEVAAAISVVARGWLDVWSAAQQLDEAETHDLAFPQDAETTEGVATGADELRGRIETGLSLLLDAQTRHLLGYTILREEAPADASVQALFDVRAAEAEDFDVDLRPQVRQLLSQRSTSVWMAVDRFTTDVPGVEPRATSADLVCIDRALLAEAGGVVTAELVDELAALTPDRADCPALPETEDS